MSAIWTVGFSAPLANLLRILGCVAGQHAERKGCHPEGLGQA